MNRNCLAILFVSALLLPLAANAATDSAVLPANTDIHLQLAETISSHTAKVGEIVRFRTVGDTSIHGVILVRDNTEAEGIVKSVKKKGHLGRAGQLDIAINFLRMPNGQKVPLIGQEADEGQGHGTRTAVATTVAVVVFWPAAPFLLLMHGKDVVLTSGTPIDVFVARDTTIPIPAK